MGRHSAWALAGLLAAAGVTHFTRPRMYDAIIPAALPGGRRFWTYASGVAELATAAAVAHPRTRTLGGYAAAGLFVAVFPANVTMAVDLRHSPHRALAFARLPMQVPLVLWAWRVARPHRARPRAARPGRSG